MVDTYSTKDKYPAWICSACGNKYGKARDTIATFHFGECGWCNKKASVTEPRDYGYPKYKPKEKTND